MALSLDGTCIVVETELTEVKCSKLRPTTVYSMGANVVKLTAGQSHFCALLEDSTAKCFGGYTGHAVFSDNSVYARGNNTYGALGDESEISTRLLVM